MSVNKVLITGAKGFVGAEIVRLFEKEYEQILTIENEKVRRNELTLQKSDRVFAVDIANREAVLRLEQMGAVDAVIHAAGLAHQFGSTSREKFQKVNVKGTANILELARKLKVKHFVLISSVSVYGHSRAGNIFTGKKFTGNKFKGEFETVRGVEETAECLPEDFYAESKLDGEKLARKFCADNRIKLTILRLATVIGEEDKGNFSHLIRQIDRRRFIWVGKGENYKSLVHKEDVALACRAVLGKSESVTEACNLFNVFNISADFLTMREIVEIISGKLKSKIPSAAIPAPLARSIFRFGAGLFAFQKIKRVEKTISKWLADDVYSAEKIRREHGFVPQISAKKAIEREVEWYMAKN
jgi:nucleoside-diphosphate-sugar epimerase